MRVVVFSDTHCKHREVSVPDGDVVVHAGDACANGTEEEQIDFLAWFSALPHRHRVFVGGNHDAVLMDERWRDEHAGFLKAWDAARGGVLYLEGGGAGLRVGGEILLIYGAPWRPRPDSWTPGATMRPGKRTSAFGVRESEVAALWEEIPEELDLLVTHVPPRGVLDEIQTPGGPVRIGCPALSTRLTRMARPPRLHVFGHAHDPAGTEVAGGRISCNAAICDAEYAVVRQPQVFDLRMVFDI